MLAGFYPDVLGSIPTSTAMRTVASVLGILGLLLVTACKKDPCKNVSCQNGGTCSDGNCTCRLPWEGSRCEVDGRDKFVGAWSGTQNCGGSVDNVRFIITKSSVEATVILIEGEIRGELTSSTTFNVPNQQIVIQGTAFTISGNGVLNGNVLTLNLNISSGGQGGTCAHTLTRL